MDNLKRRDFMKMVGIAAIAPMALLKAKPLFKKFGTTSMVFDGIVDIDKNIMGVDATCLDFSNEKEEVIEHWDFLNQEWTIQFDPLDVNFMKYLDEQHYMIIWRRSNKDGN